MKIVGSYKIPRSQAALCTGHIYNAIPTSNNRYLLSSSWYTGGTSVVDFTNPTEPREVAWHSVKPIDGQPDTMPGSNNWTTYWHNGYFYGHGVRGLEILEVDCGPLSQALDFPDGAFNPQTQLDMFDDSMGCTEFGTANADVLKGTEGPDVICGFGGGDEIYGLSGADTILGGEGHDEIYAGAGADEVKGSVGNDALFGQGGGDELSGGDGHDAHFGGPGDDVCKGGEGSNFFVNCENKNQRRRG